MKSKNSIRSFSFLIVLFLCASAVCLAQKPELVVQTGHSGSVSELVLSPDGRILVSGGYDSTIKVWEVATGRELRTLRGHVDGIHSLAFSPDGKTLVSGGIDQTIKLWDFATGQLLRTLTGHKYPVFSVVFISEGRKLVSSSGDQTIRTWDVATGKLLQTAPAALSPIVVSTDRKILAIKNDKSVVLLDAVTLEALRTLSGHTESISSFVFNGDGRILASSSSKSIKLWEVATGRELLDITGGFELADGLAFSPNGQILASSVNGRMIKLWDVATGREVGTLTGHTRPVESQLFTPDGQTLVSSDRGGRIKLWDVRTGRELRTLGPRAGGVGSAILTADGKTIVSNVVPGRVKLWGPASVRQLQIFARPAERGVPAIGVSPDGNMLATSGDESIIRLWSISSGKETLTINDAPSASTLAFSPNGRLLASGGSVIRLFDVVIGKKVLTIDNQRGSIDGIAFSPDGSTLASFGYNNWIILNDVATGRAILTITGSELVRAIAFSPDGQTLASSNRGSEITIWDLKTGHKLRTLSDHQPWVETLAYSPDGKWLASGSWDTTIKLYDVATGRVSRTLIGHSHHVNSVKFSANAKFLVSGSSDATVKIWRVDSGELLASLIALDESDWAVVTPDGRFDASANGQKLMHWMVGSEVIELAQLKERYYEPGLLAKLIGFSKEPLRNVSSFANPKLNPKVEFEQPAKGSSTLVVNLTNRGGGIGRVQVFVNDKEFLADARDEKLRGNPNVSRATLNIDLSTAPGKLSGEENKIRVQAWNVENYISSRGAEKPWLAPGPTNKEKPEVYAIVGGISQYAGAGLKLRYAGTDAVAMANAIELGAKRLFGADKVHLTLLTTAKDPRAITPTKANFNEAFAAVQRQAKPKDILVVYLAGHAVTFQQGGLDTYCYLTQEAQTTDVSDPEVRKHRTVTSDDLRDWIKLVPANKQAIMLDTCAAGAAQEQFIAAARAGSGDAVRAIELAMDRTGSHFLMGSAADAESFETSQYGQGLLTYALLKGIKGEALDDARMVDINTLFRFGSRRGREAGEEHRQNSEAKNLSAKRRYLSGGSINEGRC